MRWQWLAVVLIGVVTGVAYSDELPPGDSEVSSEVVGKASYAFGYSSGRSLKEALRLQAASVAIESWVKGFRDAMEGKESEFAEDDLRNAVDEYRRASLTKLAKKNKTEGEAFLKENAKKPGVVTRKSGLQYEVLKKGSGRGRNPGPTDIVKTHYRGTLIDGTVFDTSIGGEPFVIGVNEVIPGWTEALQLMKVGDKWRLVVPSKLAYGVNGGGDMIGPNAVLVFEIDLLGVQPARSSQNQPDDLTNDPAESQDQPDESVNEPAESSPDN